MDVRDLWNLEEKPFKEINTLREIQELCKKPLIIKNYPNPIELHSKLIPAEDLSEYVHGEKLETTNNDLDKDIKIRKHQTSLADFLEFY